MTVLTPVQHSPPASTSPQPSPRVAPILPHVITPSMNAPTADTNAMPNFWSAWLMMTVFVFIGFECILLAAAMKGSWFILVAPGVVCSVKAWDAWKALQKAADA